MEQPCLPPCFVSQGPLGQTLPVQDAGCLTESRRGEAHTNLKRMKSSKIPSARSAMTSATAITRGILPGRDPGSCPATSTAQTQAPT